MSKGAVPVPYFLASTCRWRGRVRRIGLMWRSPLGRGWVGMLMIGFVWAARSRLPSYLHCSIDQRLLTLETCCGYGYDLRRESNTRPPDFQGQASATPDAAPDAALYGAAVPISDPVGFRQTRSLQIKEKTTLSGAPASVSGLHSFAALTTYRRRAPPSGSGILTRFPFCTLSWFWLL